MKQKSANTGMGRRGFLKTAAAGTGLTILPSQQVFGAAANERIRIGLIGCGGRGRWITDLFQKDGRYEFVGAHDYFRDRVNEVGKKVGVPEKNQFVGLDGYKDLLALDIDAVVIESPPYYHPEQSMAAVEAGKHVYLAKPVAVDVPGCNTIIDAGKKAKGKLSFLVDFQTRKNEFFIGAAERVHKGDIGIPVTGEFKYHCGRLGRRKYKDKDTFRLRDWVHDQVLSGDVIVEQNIHVLDVANWYLQGHPETAYGMGGRKARTDTGDTWDHFLVQYVYPNEVRIDFSSAQFTYGYGDLCMRLYCSEGTVDSHYGGEVSISGKSTSWKGGNSSKIYHEGAANNIKDFAESLLSGKYIDNSEESAHSTLTSVLGRIAAYEQRVVTWDEMMAANTKLDANMTLPADGPDRM